MENTSLIEQGPIRPPNEAESLLIRVTRNCPWNRCLFCPVYKGEKFSKRSVEEVKRDIDEIAASLEQVRNIVEYSGVDEGTFNHIMRNHPELLSAVSWWYSKDRSVFLQDADSVILKTGEMLEILQHLLEKIPEVGRITTYARSRTLSHKSTEELKELKEAGLSRVHVGLESGCDEVLEYVKKGATSTQQVEAGKKVKEAGLILSHYIILGLGGRNKWREHAIKTAEVINQVDPDFIRVRSLALHSLAPLSEEYQAGRFNPMNDEEVVREERLLLENLEGITGTIYSDHILNLLEEVQGTFPEDRERMLEVIDNFLALSQEEKEIFILGRRTGIFRYLNDRFNSSGRERAKKILEQLRKQGTDTEEFVRELTLRYL